MSLIENIHVLSTKKDWFSQTIFWGSIVVINASVGFSLGHEMRSSVFGMSLGVGVWILLYITFGRTGYQRLGELGHQNLQMSLLYGYIIKTIYSLTGICSYALWGKSQSAPLLNWIFTGLDFSVGILSIAILKTLGILDKLYDITEFGDILGTLGITLIHGGLMSIITILISLLIYSVIRIVKRKS